VIFDHAEVKRLLTHLRLFSDPIPVRRARDPSRPLDRDLRLLNGRARAPRWRRPPASRTPAPTATLSTPRAGRGGAIRAPRPRAAPPSRAPWTPAATERYPHGHDRGPFMLPTR
jgi:hypothetical protein